MTTEKIDKAHSLTLRVHGENIRTIGLTRMAAGLIYDEMETIAILLAVGDKVKIRITGE